MAYNFPASPSLGDTYQGYVWDGEKWLAGNAVGPVLATKKNYVVNGAMMVSQENGTTAITANGGYAVDQFMTGYSNAGQITYSQSANRTPSGSPYRLRCVNNSADATLDAGDIAYVATRIEGLRIADMNFGLASAKTFTLQFGVRAPAGTWHVMFRNAADNRCYVAPYTVSAGEANTDVVKTITVTGDVTGTWAADNTIGLWISWVLQAGTTYQTATINAWHAATTKFAPSSQFNFMTPAFNVFELFDVSLTEGPVAPPFVVPDYASELALCQRYWRRFDNFLHATGYCPAGLTYYNAITWQPPMRAGPTVTCVASGSGQANTSGALGVSSQSAATCFISIIAATSGGAYIYTNITTNARM